MKKELLKQSIAALMSCNVDGCHDALINKLNKYIGTDRFDDREFAKKELLSGVEAMVTTSDFFDKLIVSDLEWMAEDDMAHLICNSSHTKDPLSMLFFVDYGDGHTFEFTANIRDEMMELWSDIGGCEEYRELGSATVLELRQLADDIEALLKGR